MTRERAPVASTRHTWVLGRPNDDHEAWVAHCLDLDISAKGDTIWDALDAVEKAVSRAVREDARRGRTPFDRPRASPAEWERLWAIVRGGILVTEEDLALGTRPFDVIATQLAVDLSRAVRVQRASAALVPTESRQLTG